MTSRDNSCISPETWTVVWDCEASPYFQGRGLVLNAPQGELQASPLLQGRGLVLKTPWDLLQSLSAWLPWQTSLSRSQLAARHVNAHTMPRAALPWDSMLRVPDSNISEKAYSRDLLIGQLLLSRSSPPSFVKLWILHQFLWNCHKMTNITLLGIFVHGDFCHSQNFSRVHVHNLHFSFTGSFYLPPWKSRHLSHKNFQIIQNGGGVAVVFTVPKFRLDFGAQIFWPVLKRLSDSNFLSS